MCYSTVCRYQNPVKLLQICSISMMPVWVMLFAQMWYFVSLLIYIGLSPVYLSVSVSMNSYFLLSHCSCRILFDSCSTFVVNKRIYNKHVIAMQTSFPCCLSLVPATPCAASTCWTSVTWCSVFSVSSVIDSSFSSSMSRSASTLTQQSRCTTAGLDIFTNRLYLNDDH